MAAPEYEFHPASEITPLIEGTAFDLLCDSIKAHGQLAPIEILDGMIIDGRNRYRACKKLKREPWIVEIERPDMTPIEYVVAVNITRRNLAGDQIIAVGARLLRELVQPKSNGQPGMVPTQAAERAAKAVGISRRHLSRGERVLRYGCAVLIAKLSRGAISLRRAEAICRAPGPEQTLALSRGDRAVKRLVEKYKHVKLERGVDDPTKEEEESRDKRRGPKASAFETVKRLAKELEDFAKEIMSLAKDIPSNPWLGSGTMDTIAQQLRAAAATVRTAKPAATCRDCTGKGCVKCRQTGYLPKNVAMSRPNQQN